MNTLNLPPGPLVWLLDTNILLRPEQTASPHYSAVVTSLRYLVERGDRLVLGTQVLMEYWRVATAPIDRNGLGLSPSVTGAKVRLIQSQFSVLSETNMLLPTWLDLCEQAEVKGREVYDTRLVALMQTAGVSCLLTLNDADFRRFIPLTSITVLSPLTLVQSISNVQ